MRPVCGKGVGVRAVILMLEVPPGESTLLTSSQITPPHVEPTAETPWGTRCRFHSGRGFLSLKEVETDAGRHRLPLNWTSLKSPYKFGVQFNSRASVSVRTWCPASNEIRSINKQNEEMLQEQWPKTCQACLCKREPVILAKARQAAAGDQDTAMHQMKSVWYVVT